MGVYLAPTANGEVSNADVTPSTLSAYEAVASSRIAPANVDIDASYIQGNIGGALMASFGFPWPFPTTKAYGDGYNLVEDTVSNLTLYLRMNTIFGTATPTPVMYDSDATETILGDDFTVTTTIEEFSLSLDSSPLTNIDWSPSEIGSRTFGIACPVASGGNNLRVYRFYVEVTWGTPVGQARARLKPRLGEPALYCALCGVPSHISRLIRVEEPRHPHVDLWVCKNDLDEINREPVSPEFVEGDFDFDLR